MTMGAAGQIGPAYYDPHYRSYYRYGYPPPTKWERAAGDIKTQSDREIERVVNSSSRDKTIRLWDLQTKAIRFWSARKTLLAGGPISELIDWIHITGHDAIELAP